MYSKHPPKLGGEPLLLNDCLMLEIFICPDSALSHEEAYDFLRKLDCLRKSEDLWNQGPGCKNQNYQPLILDTPVTFRCSCCYWILQACPVMKKQELVIYGDLPNQQGNPSVPKKLIWEIQVKTSPPHKMSFISQLGISASLARMFSPGKEK